jgi:hypothetical protein
MRVIGYRRRKLPQCTLPTRPGANPPSPHIEFQKKISMHGMGLLMLRPFWVAEAEDDARSAMARDQGRRAPSCAAEARKYKTNAHSRSRIPSDQASIILSYGTHSQRTFLHSQPGNMSDCTWMLLNVRDWSDPLSYSITAASLTSKVVPSTTTLTSLSGTKREPKPRTSKLITAVFNLISLVLPISKHFVWPFANRLWEYRNGAFVNVNSGKVLDIKGGNIRSDGKLSRFMLLGMGRLQLVMTDTFACNSSYHSI